MARHDARWPWWVETVLVVVVCFVSVPEASVATGGRFTSPDVVASLVAGCALPLRHRRPLPVTALAVAAGGCFGAMLPLLLVSFHLTALGKVKIAASSTALALGVNALVQPPLSLWAPRTYGPCGLLIVALALGLWASSSRRLADALARQMEHLHRERELRESAARSSERTAIAAEMHDVLAHRLSLIALHSGVLATRAEQLPPVVADRVRLLRTASTDALADLRDVLGALRDSTARGDSRAPALREVDELLDAAREAGQRVVADLGGDAAGAPAAHRLAVFRVVQEAVTNARKHAPEAAVHVRVRYGAPATRVEVTNAAGGEGAAVRSGYGLIGLGERVRALGGELEAGPSGDGAWRVSARLPLVPGPPPGAVPDPETCGDAGGRERRECHSTGKGRRP
ncbi:sensor histidine kinase [Streptomyces hoynatensis]|uniref:sensor histidine kinase n=1 Tax=Streptomyces hoynatensis TaxID=1141874 RepID=UPI001F4E939E|nr:histidine kinase [Streptomyces hoynatensis]